MFLEIKCPFVTTTSRIQGYPFRYNNCLQLFCLGFWGLVFFVLLVVIVVFFCVCVDHLLCFHVGVDVLKGLFYLICFFVDVPGFGVISF